MNFKDWIKNQNIRQQWVAADLQITEGHLSYILSGKRKPSGSLVRDIETLTGGAVLFADFFPREATNERAIHSDHSGTAGQQIKPAALGKESKNRQDAVDQKPGSAGL